MQIGDIVGALILACIVSAGVWFTAMSNNLLGHLIGIFVLLCSILLVGMVKKSTTQEDINLYMRRLAFKTRKEMYQMDRYKWRKGT